MLGGLIGIGISFGICGMIARTKLFQPIITSRNIAMAMAVCAGVGILFGVTPAVRAANLNPIDALRHE